MKKKICMIVQDKMVKGGIAAVVNGYRGSSLEKKYDIIYVESYKDGGRLAKLWKAICAYFKFIKVIIVDKPELIHIHSSFGASFYRKIPFIYIAYFFKKPIINHIHGANFETFYIKSSQKKKRLIKSVYSKCSVLIALSIEWKDKLSMIVPKERIVVIENYSILHEEALKERLKRKQNNKVLFLGEIGQRKGCYDIPDIVELVVRKMPDVKFILAGTGDVKAISKLLKERNVYKNVSFPGWVRGVEKDKLLREADLFLLPSYNEGLPMSILDAMGYGLPIISTNVGGIPKLIKDNKNGFICEPGDVNSFAESIIKMFSDSNKLKSACKESYEIANKKYSLSSHLMLLEELYRRYL